MATSTEKVGCCTRCSRICFNTALLTSFVFFLMIIVLHAYARNYSFFVKPHSWNLVTGFADFFISAFALMYFAAGLTILYRFYKKQRLCRTDNCSFYIFSVGILVLSLVGRNYINEDAQAHEADFSLSCAELALDERVPQDSFIREANVIYGNADKLLCSNDCPCDLREDAVSGAITSARIHKDPAGAKTVRLCATYEANIYGGDEDKLWQFEQQLMDLEEQSQCSGICDRTDEVPLALFYFSNVNNGEPQLSCKEPLSQLISDNIAYFHRLYLAGALLSGIMLGILLILFVCQVYLYCRRKCDRKKLPK